MFAAALVLPACWMLEVLCVFSGCVSVAGGGIRKADIKPDTNRAGSEKAVEASKVFMKDMTDLMS